MPPGSGQTFRISPSRGRNLEFVHHNSSGCRAESGSKVSIDRRIGLSLAALALATTQRQHQVQHDTALETVLRCLDRIVPAPKSTSQQSTLVFAFAALSGRVGAWYATRRDGGRSSWFPVSQFLFQLTSAFPGRSDVAARVECPPSPRLAP